MDQMSDTCLNSLRPLPLVLMPSRSVKSNVLGVCLNLLVSSHPETAFMGVILRSPADGGATKNLLVNGSAEILRFAQNDMEEFPDQH